MNGHRIGSAVATATLLATVFGGHGPAAAQQDPTFMVDFEDAPANRSGTPAAAPLTDRYADLGLYFDTPVTPLIYDGQSIPALEDFAHSGRTVVTTCYAAEFCSNEVVLRLDPPHARVGLRVGYRGSLNAPAELVATGFARDEPIAADRVVLGPSDEPVPVDALVALFDGDGRLTRVEVRWADPSRFLGGLAIDDIELVPFVPHVEVAATPETLQLDARQGRATEQVVFGNVGNVDVAIGDVVLQRTGGDARDDLRIANSTCAGMLQRDGSCEVLVAFDPADGADDAAGVVMLLARDGQALVSVPVEGRAPQIQDTGASGDDGVAVRGAGARDPSLWLDAVIEWLAAATSSWPPAALVLVVPLLGLLGAVRWTLRRRDPPEPSPHVRCRLVDDAGTQTIEPSGHRLVGIHASSVPRHGSITIEGGEAVREVEPR